MTTVRLLVAACVLAARSAGAGGAVNTSPLIGFDDLSPGTVVDTQYAGSYVVFGGGAQIANYEFAPGFPHSGLQTLEPCYGDEFCTNPLLAAFLFAVRRVTVWVGPTGSHPVNSLTFALRALDAHGVELGRDEVTLPPNEGQDSVRYPLEVAADGIYAVEVTVGPGFFDNEQLAVDDFGFTLADAVCGNGIMEPTESCDLSTGENACPASTPSCVGCLCLPRCGDGIVDEGEECDDGNLLSTTDCCARDCTVRFVGEACGDQSATVCDGPDRCDAQGRCDAQRQPAGVSCRAAGTIDACDAGDACDGTSLECPTFGVDGGCTATVPAVIERPSIPVECVSSGNGRARCTATGFAAAPAASLAAVEAPPNLVRVTRTKHGRLKRKRSEAGSRRVLTLRLDRTGKRLLRVNGSLEVTIRITVTKGVSSRTFDRLVRILRG